LKIMRRAAGFFVYALATACWLAGGPGGATVDALLACRHHQAHHTHVHTGAPSDGPCFCSEMTGGSDQAISPAVPAPLPTQPVVSVARRVDAHPAPFPLPPSPSFAPESPPPNTLA
jgi:hypothetical protein